MGKDTEGGQQTLQQGIEEAIQWLCVFLPETFHTKMAPTSFNHDCTGFQLHFVALIQARDFQPMPQRNPVLEQFAGFWSCFNDLPVTFNTLDHIPRFFESIVAVPPL